MSRRLRLPVVTSFLLLGLLVGPEGLGIMSASITQSLRIVEPVALGMITFAAGEQLHFSDIRVLSRRDYWAVVAETLLPVVLVGAGAWLLTRRVEIALPIAAIAGTTGLATVMSTLREAGAKGAYTKFLGFAVASDNLLAIVAFSLLLPLLVGMETGAAIGALYAERLLSMLASVGIGLAAGYVVSRLVRTIESPQELSMLVLAHVLVVVGITEYLGFSVLLAGVTMGAAAANLTVDPRDRDRAFGALRMLEFPVIAMFFIWAGASLHLRAFLAVGPLFAMYLVLRAVGKLAGPLTNAWLVRGNDLQRRRFLGLGMSLLPQAGAAVGLGTLARDLLPSSGETILVAVLAAVVVFELVGPLGVHWSVKHVGEGATNSQEHPLTLDEAIERLQDQKARIAVLVDVDADPSVLEAPRLLAARLGADLTVLPVYRAGTGDTGPWPRVKSTAPVTAVGAADDADAQNRVAEEVVLAPIAVGGGELHHALQVLSEHSPDVMLVTTGTGATQVLRRAQEADSHITCPIFQIPECFTRESGAGRGLSAHAAVALAGLVGRLRQVRRRTGRPAPSDGPDKNVGAEQ